MVKRTGVCPKCGNQPSPIPIGVAAAMQVVVNHFWNDELRDYRGSPIGVKNAHVFRHLLTMNSWLRSAASDDFEEDEWEYF